MNLEDMLRQRAEEARLTPTTLGRVQGRARAIRRRRAAVAVTSTIAGVAAVAIVAVVAIPGSTDSARTIHPAAPTTTTSTSSTTDSPTASPGPSGAVVNIDPQNVEQTYGGEPNVPYWMDGTLTDYTGAITPAGDVASFGYSAQGNGNRWIIAKQGGPTGWTITDQQFSDTPMPTTYPDIAVTGDNTVKAYLAEFPDSATGGQKWEIHAETGSMLGGPHTWPLTGEPTEGSGVNGILPGVGVLATVDGQLSVYKDDGSVVAVPGKYVSAGASDSGLVALESLAASQAPQPCWTFVDSSDLGNAQAIQSGRQVCGPETLAFSPSGKYLLELDFGSSVGGPGGLTQASIVDLAPWKTVAQFEAPRDGAFSASVGWSTTGSVIVPTFAGTPDASGKTFNGQWALVWLNADGSWKVGRATQKPGSFDHPAYKIGQGPMPISLVVSGG